MYVCIMRLRLLPSLHTGLMLGTAVLAVCTSFFLVRDRRGGSKGPAHFEGNGGGEHEEKKKRKKSSLPSHLGS